MVPNHGFDLAGAVYRLQFKGGVADGLLSRSARMVNPPWPDMWVAYEPCNQPRKHGPTCEGNLQGWAEPERDTQHYCFTHVETPTSARDADMEMVAVYVYAELEPDEQTAIDMALANLLERAGPRVERGRREREKVPA